MRKRVDLTTLPPDSKAYWDEVLRREGLTMARGKYVGTVKYGWKYRDRDARNTQIDTEGILGKQISVPALPVGG
jgi:hypothetical protein